MAIQHFDVLIVGAGLSGIGAARHLQKQCPNKTYAILESRDAIGGTWDLFRYPGIRSDSDMYTLGYSFKPWTNPKAIADGPSIRSYIQEAAREAGIDKHIRFGHKIVKSSWSSDDAQWTVEALQNDTGKTVKYTCNFLFMCTGYYNYDAGYTPHFEGRERFKGQIIHPQHWPENLDYSGKKVVIIGSGATAVTLLPAMTRQGRACDHAAALAHLCCVHSRKGPDCQQSASFPAGEDGVPRHSRQERVADAGLLQSLQEAAEAHPPPAAGSSARPGGQRLRHEALHAQLQPVGRAPVCRAQWRPVQNAAQGQGLVVTDHIDTFTETGIQLKSGQHLDADIIITATGLDLQIMGGMQVKVDGKPVDMTQRMNYKGIMFEGMPNIAMVFRLHQRQLDAERPTSAANMSAAC
jgi:monooxygenase